MEIGSLNNQNEENKVNQSTNYQFLENDSSDEGDELAQIDLDDSRKVKRVCDEEDMFELGVSSCNHLTYG